MSTHNARAKLFALTEVERFFEALPDLPEEAIEVAVNVECKTLPPQASSSEARRAETDSCTHGEVGNSPVCLPRLGPGDVVSLKSGGPPMTIGDERPEGLLCVWFSHDGAPGQGVFPLNALERRAA